MSEPAHLIDIASYNTVTDWNAVHADGIVGASIKVSQATNYLNPLRTEQVVGARRAKVAPGGYHFGDPRVGATEQARFFVNNAKPLGLFDEDALAPMYDAENWEGGGLLWAGRTQLSTHIREFVKVVHGETGARRVLVYGSLNWWQIRWLVPEDWAVDGVEVLNWIAVYNGQPGNLQGWSHPLDAVHQHTSKGLVPGVAGDVDKNVTLRDRQLGALVLGGGDDDMATSDERLTAIESKLDRILTVFFDSVNGPVVGGGPGIPETLHDIVQRNGDETRKAVVAESARVIEAVTNLELGGGATDDQVERVMRTSGLFDDVVRKGQPVQLADTSVHNPPSGG
jgi:GH25 family lysozyme M1 (1,4-beta-N-acetylmuramidase)